MSRDEVTWLRSASLAEDYERLKLRAVSVFEHVSEEVIEARFAMIEAPLPYTSVNTRPAVARSNARRVRPTRADDGTN